ncbi:hypothetical protein CERSUDRAFT_100052 [Gelatoporia subvermispora B]|uniref:Uncharacterized protein n=1 Tax=Ceriporiopsis subvermispora (strain B) TaxID=914234 RepID=M2QIA1_CERS8|nr:hypothetical protein CERSUDRAFT_100052 [Gelatoporia subvermispora B]
MTTRTLTFKSTDLGENVNLMLCFAAPSGDWSASSSPIAWRVTTLAAKGRSAMTATYANNLAFARTQVDGGSLVYASNYVPISPGQHTTLRMDDTVTPPTYFFEDPTSIPGISVEAKNGTGQVTDIALGFIENLGEPNEIMDPALVYKNIGSGQSVTVDFVPIVRAYVNVNYSQNQMLRADIQHASLVWEGNLWDMQPFTTFEVYRNERGGISVRQVNTVNVTHRTEVITREVDSFNGVNGSTVMNGMNSMNGVNSFHRLSVYSVPDSFESKKLYTVSVAFASADQVVSGVKTLIDRVMSNGYFIKFTYKEGSTDAQLEFSLPQGVSCDQAEKELLAAIDAQAKPSERACIRCRGGALMVSGGEHFAYWVDISPASTEWYVSGKNTLVSGAGMAGTVMSSTVVRGRPVQISQVGTNGYLTADIAGPRATKNRSLSRKRSAVSLRAVGF